MTRNELNYIKKLAKKGNLEALIDLGDMYYSGQNLLPDKKEALRLHTLAAEQGDADTQFLLGYIYDSGECGTEANGDTAVKWYTLAAEQGHEDAMVNIGWMYANGQGVKKNRAKRTKWHMMAAAQNVRGLGFKTPYE